jgi:hypothetical protein
MQQDSNGVFVPSFLVVVNCIYYLIDALFVFQLILQVAIQTQALVPHPVLPMLNLLQLQAEIHPYKR